jgi:hypothetical protein
MVYQTETEFRELLQRYRALEPRSRVLEIGSLGGETLRHWIEGAGPGGTVISVDWRVPPSDARYTAHKFGQEILWPQWASDARVNLTVFNADSTKSETIANVRNVVSQLDFLFIDGGHDYATVRADFFNYTPLVRPGGLIALHDIQGIADVARFWNEIKGGCDWEECCHPGGWGIGLIRAQSGPQLTIITPYSRPGNLQRMLPGVERCRAVFDVHWMIVHDGSMPLEGYPDWILPQSYHPPDPVAGKAQINYALETIETGWVWVLDDDNVVHPDFARNLQEMLVAHPEAKAFVFAQICGNSIRGVGPHLVRECSIDQAQFVLRRNFIGHYRYPVKYTGDGAFVEMLHAIEPQAFRFCPTPSVYYNALSGS